MGSKIVETTHDYEPINKYIDEKSRIKRTKSVWGYTKSLALFLIALGIFLILAAYAYHIFKKPHPLHQDQIDQEQSENINKEIIKKNNQIQQLEGSIAQLESNIGQLEADIENNPENKQLTQQLAEKTEEAEKIKKEAEKTIKEKEEIEKKLEEKNRKIVDGEVIKYNKTTHQFESVEREGYLITTRRKYPTTTDLLEQTGKYKETCYISKNNMKFEYSEPVEFQMKALNVIGLTENQAMSYKKYCQYTK